MKIEVKVYFEILTRGFLRIKQYNRVILFLPLVLLINMQQLILYYGVDFKLQPQIKS